MSSFGRYDLHDRVLSKLPELGFRKPTQVQEKVIPMFLQGFNLIVEAPTGTGKTAAYGLPLISRINILKRSTQALVVAPTRELAMQIADALRSFFDGEQLKIGAVYGGVSMEESFEAIKATPHILIAVPGRLKDVMAHYQFDYLWRDIKFFIIDEGDKLMEMGFVKDFDDLRMHIRNTVQIGFFSATIARDIEALIREKIRSVKTVRLSPRQVLKNIKFGYIDVSRGQRESHLLAVLDQYEVKKALIFCSRREDIHTLSGFMRNHGLKAESYYGSQSQDERQHVLKRFKEDHIDFLVASDLAARGLDIEQLPAVINISVPKNFDFYLHRVGRTGRAGNSGKVFTLVNSPQERIWLNQHHQQIDLPIRQKTVSLEKLQLQEPTSNNKWIKAHLSRGKRDKIRKADIAGFFIHEVKLDMDQIGTINVYEAYSTVDIPEVTLKSLNRKDSLKIKGKSVKVRKYQLAEQERKAKAIKNLKKDRR